MGIVYLILIAPSLGIAMTNDYRRPEADAVLARTALS
jgi:hypothetical protein